MQKNILAAALASTLTRPAADVTEPLSDAALEQKIEDAKPTAPRITKEHIQALIVDETYTNLEGTRTTVCRLELANGFCVVGINNGPVSAANFSQEIGCEYAYKAAVDQIWPLEGYLLAERLFRAATEDEKVAKLRELLAIQRTPGTVDAGEYMRGMANGLAVALSVFDGIEPQFVEAPADAQTGNLADLVRKAQGVLASYLPPDGITERDCITQLLGLLDGPESRAALKDAPPATTYQQRVIAEKEELDGRIVKLDAFFTGPFYANLDPEEQSRMNQQRHAMSAYSAALADRIAAF